VCKKYSWRKIKSAEGEMSVLDQPHPIEKSSADQGDVRASEIIGKQ